MSRAVDSRRGSTRGRGRQGGPPEPFGAAGAPPGVIAELSPAARRWLGGGLGVLASVVGVGLVLSAGAGVQEFMDYFAGVLSLVALTGAVMWGVISTGVILGPRGRIWSQGVHRALAVISLGFLVLHVGIKVSEQEASVMQVILPIGTTAHTILVAVGVIAGYLLVLSVGTGLARGAFAARRHPVRWRLLHAASYVSWLAALVHGLKAGRPAAWWVTASYVVCLIVVGIAVAVRLRAPSRQDVAPSIRRQTMVPMPTGRRRASGRRRRGSGTVRMTISSMVRPPEQGVRSRIEGRR